MEGSDPSNLPPQGLTTPQSLPTTTFSPYSQQHRSGNQASPSSPAYSQRNPAIDPSLHALGQDGFHVGFPQPLDHRSARSLQLNASYSNNNTHLQQSSPSHLRLQDSHQSPLSPSSRLSSQLTARQQQQRISPTRPRFNGLDAQRAQPSLDSFTPNGVVQNIDQNTTLTQGHAESATGKKDSNHFQGLKAIADPPLLDEWRKRLFDAEGTITMTEDEFQTYFPHVDNVYSHRSTQRYKRKPFVSHYWDCRLKGRPPGTPKSDDPNKKKRKRQVRERDLCDVKIKITEYFPGARATLAQLGESSTDSAGDVVDSAYGTDSLLNLGTVNEKDGAVPGVDGERYYTITRVNGSSSSGKVEGTPGGHKHTLEDSDRIKKSSIQRQFLKEGKDRKKLQKTYHKKATGLALQTVKKHSKEHELKIYGSCFCPFVQRLWIAMEHKGLQYQYIEVDPYKKPDSLLALNPLGLVPALQHGSFSCHESTVLLEYVEDAFPNHPLLPPTPEGRAHARLWADHVNRKLIPSFYHTLQAQEPNTQASAAKELKTHIQKLVDAADQHGPFFSGPNIGWVDVQLAPWLLRLSRVLGPYRGWPSPENGSRWARWVNAVEGNESVKNTTSGDELYKDSYERYAENRPGTSQVADAVNSGRGLP